MKLTMVAGDCKGPRECPTVYMTDRGTIAVQGYQIADVNEGSVPKGEGVVEISKELLLEAARAIG